jgi:hypothetical protein
MFKNFCFVDRIHVDIIELNPGFIKVILNEWVVMAGFSWAIMNTYWMEIIRPLFKLLVTLIYFLFVAIYLPLKIWNAVPDFLLQLL